MLPIGCAAGSSASGSSGIYTASGATSGGGSGTGSGRSAGGGSAAIGSGTGGGAIIGATGIGAAARGNLRGTDSWTRAGEVGSLFGPLLSGWMSSKSLGK